MIWKKDIRINEGTHQLKIISPDGSFTYPKIIIEKDQTKCFHHPWENSGINLSNIDYDSCPS
jgi:hypothetical protein